MRLARDLREHAVTADGGYAYYSDGHVGGILQALCRWYRWSGAPQPVFTLKSGGNDLVSITPREDGPAYPLYRRRPRVDATAPIRIVGRVLPDRLVEL